MLLKIAYVLLKFAIASALTAMIALLIMLGVFTDQDLLNEYFRDESEDDGRTDYFRRR